MVWLQWLQAHIPNVALGLGSLGALLAAIGYRIVTINGWLDAVTSLWTKMWSAWRTFRGKPAVGGDTSPMSSISQTKQIENKQTNIDNSKQSAGIYSAAIGDMSHS